MVDLEENDVLIIIPFILDRIIVQRYMYRIFHLSWTFITIFVILYLDYSTLYPRKKLFYIDTEYFIYRGHL